MPRVPTISRYERPPAERRTGEHRHPTSNQGHASQMRGPGSFETHPVDAATAASPNLPVQSFE